MNELTALTLSTKALSDDSNCGFPGLAQLSNRDNEMMPKIEITVLGRDGCLDNVITHSIISNTNQMRIADTAIVVQETLVSLVTMSSVGIS